MIIAEVSKTHAFRYTYTDTLSVLYINVYLREVSRTLSNIENEAFCEYSAQFSAVYFFFAKRSILDNWQGSKYISVHLVFI